MMEDYSKRKPLFKPNEDFHLSWLQSHNEFPNEIPEGWYRCIHCKQIVGAGMIPQAMHYGDCAGKPMVDALMALSAGAKEMPPDELREKVKNIMGLTDEDLKI